jgi:membrane-bound lytic murein transglycosylase D
MRTSVPRLFLGLAIIPAFFLSVASVRAQIPATPSLRSSAPSDIERDAGAVTQLIERAEAHFKQGELNLKDRNPEAARAEFDKAVDTLLESGMDVRANPRLQTYYLQLVERVYRLEVPTQQTPTQTVVANAQPQIAQGVKLMPMKDQTGVQQTPPPQIGFLREQKFEPSPLDELSKL